MTQTRTPSGSGIHGAGNGRVPSTERRNGNVVWKVNAESPTTSARGTSSADKTNVLHAVSRGTLDRHDGQMLAAADERDLSLHLRARPVAHQGPVPGAPRRRPAGVRFRLGPEMGGITCRGGPRRRRHNVAVLGVLGGFFRQSPVAGGTQPPRLRQLATQLKTTAGTAVGLWVGWEPTVELSDVSNSCSRAVVWGGCNTRRATETKRRPGVGCGTVPPHTGRRNRPHVAPRPDPRLGRGAVPGIRFDARGARPVVPRLYSARAKQVRSPSTQQVARVGRILPDVPISVCVAGVPPESSIGSLRIKDQEFPWHVDLPFSAD